MQKKIRLVDEKQEKQEYGKISRYGQS